MVSCMKFRVVYTYCEPKNDSSFGDVVYQVLVVIPVLWTR